MSVLFIALPLALLLGGGGMIACILCIRSGQYEDLDTPAVRILVDDQPEETSPPKEPRPQARSSADQTKGFNS